MDVDEEGGAVAARAPEEQEALGRDVVLFAHVDVDEEGGAVAAPAPEEEEASVVPAARLPWASVMHSSRAT